jgi:hypothetical protein
MITRGFNLEDVFLMSEIIDKMSLEADVDKITKQIKTSKLENKQDAAKIGKEVAVAIGLDLITKIIRSFHKAKNEVIQLISNLTGMKLEEVSKMSLKQIREFFTELVNHEEFGDFLNQAGE